MGTKRNSKAYRLVCYVPETHIEAVKAALFRAGAGRIGGYDCCCWQTAGVGQFRPLPGSRPFLGQAGSIEHVVEYKVELVCAGGCLQRVLAALRAAHPYETPAFMYWPVSGVEPAPGAETNVEHRTPNVQRRTSKSGGRKRAAPISTKPIRAPPAGGRTAS